MLRALVWVLFLSFGAIGWASHPFHRDRAHVPWLDWRPTVKARPGKDRRVRPYFTWPSPCYLDLAPVVFPGPPPRLKPLFADRLVGPGIAALAPTLGSLMLPVVDSVLEISMRELTPRIGESGSAKGETR